MNKTLRISLVSLFALISSTIFAQTTVKFDFVPADSYLQFGLTGISSSNPVSTAGDFTEAKSSTINGATLTVSPKTTSSIANRMWSGTLRVYSGTLTFTAPGKTITNITFTAETWNASNKASVGSLNAKVWTGSAETVVISIAGNSQIASIDVTYADSGTPVKKSADLAFTGGPKIKVEQGTPFTSPAFTKATSAPVTFASDNEAVATVNTDGVITLAGGKGTANITASSVENADYNAGTASVAVTVFAYKLYTKATTLTSGKPYLFVAQRNDSTFYAYPVASNKTYGYLQSGGISGKVDQIKVEDTYNDEFTITSSGNGYTIVDGQNRYVYHKAGTYNTFDVSATAPTDVWTVEPQTDGTFKFSYPDGYYIQFGDQLFSSFGVYNEAKALGILPMLYEYNENATTGISTVSPANGTLNQNASLYNLAGQRVDNNYKGIVIQNGKKMIKK